MFAMCLQLVQNQSLTILLTGTKLINIGESLAVVINLKFPHLCTMNHWESITQKALKHKDNEIHYKGFDNL